MTWNHYRLLISSSFYISILFEAKRCFKTEFKCLFEKKIKRVFNGSTCKFQCCKTAFPCDENIFKLQIFDIKDEWALRVN